MANQWGLLMVCDSECSRLSNYLFFIVRVLTKQIFQRNNQVFFSTQCTRKIVAFKWIFPLPCFLSGGGVPLDNVGSPPKNIGPWPGRLIMGTCHVEGGILLKMNDSEAAEKNGDNHQFFLNNFSITKSLNCQTVDFLDQVVHTEKCDSNIFRQYIKSFSIPHK